MKARRQKAIMEIVNSQKVSTQEELRDALVKLGFNVTQATVSRDIREMKLIKVPVKDGYRYALPEANNPVRPSVERMKRVFKDSVVDLIASENLIVVKTLPGTANSVASTIDGAEILQIAGTVAGDDTIIVVVKPKSAVNKIMERFRLLVK